MILDIITKRIAGFLFFSTFSPNRPKVGPNLGLFQKRIAIKFYGYENVKNVPASCRLEWKSSKCIKVWLGQPGCVLHWFLHVCHPQGQNTLFTWHTHMKTLIIFFLSFTFYILFPMLLDHPFTTPVKRRNI